MEDARHCPFHLQSMVVEFFSGLFPSVPDALNFVAFICMFLSFLVHGLFFNLPHSPFMDVFIVFVFHPVFEIIFFLDDVFWFDIFVFPALFFPFVPSPLPALPSGIPLLGGWLGFLEGGGGGT